jgi:hypothetical protein
MKTKCVQKDTDAQWVAHNGENYFGIKIILRRIGKQNSSQAIKPLQPTYTKVKCWKLLDKNEDGRQCVYADSALSQEALEEVCRKKNIENYIHEKGYRKSH